MEIILSLILVFGLACTGMAADPEISGLSESGGNYIIIGTNFGTNGLNIEWTGDNIEAGTVGSPFSKSRWDIYPEDDSEPDKYLAPRYSTVRAHSGAKSIEKRYVNSSVGYWAKMGYTHPEDITDIYATYWVYLDDDASTASWAQWKLFRLNPSGIEDTSPEIVQFIYPKSYAQSLCRPESTTSRWYSLTQDHAVQFFNPSGTTPTLSGGAWPKDNQWSRVELYVKASTQGGRDGSFRLYYHTDSGIVLQAVGDGGYLNYFDDSLMTYGASQTGRFRYFVLHDYLGNGSGRDGNEKIYIDDVFLQFGAGYARVEIGNASTWTACTRREVQVPTAWSADSITIDPQIGEFETISDKWLYVVNSDMEVNSTGYLIGSPATEEQGQMTGATCTGVSSVVTAP